MYRIFQELVHLIRELSIYLLHDDIPRRFYNGSDLRSLGRIDWVGTDVRRWDPGIPGGRRIRR